MVSISSTLPVSRPMEVNASAVSAGDKSIANIFEPIVRKYSLHVILDDSE
jgi:hypothetical protein